MSRMKDYDEDAWLTSYLWAHYSHLMTRAEQRAHRVAMLRAKAAAGSPPMLEKKIRRLEDKAVRELLSPGVEAFRAAAARRLIEKKARKVDLNRCPSCQRIPRSPKATQCPWCFSVWR